MAAITSVIGWTFARVDALSSAVAHIEEAEKSDEAHAVMQDKWIDEINKKMEINQAEMRAAISQVDGHVNDVRARLDGKYKVP